MVAPFREEEVGRAGGDAEEVGGRVELDEREPLLVGRPDRLAGHRIAADADPIRRLDQDVRALADPPDDVAEHGEVARVPAVLVAGVNMDDRRAGLAAQACVLGDLLRRDRDVRAVATHLHAAVDGGDDHQRLCHDPSSPNLTRI